MPESRDRLSRPVDYAAIIVRRRAGDIDVLADEQEMGTNLFGITVARTPSAATVRRATGLGTMRGGGHLRGSFGTPRSAGNGRGRNLFRYSSVNRENTPAGSTRRGRGRAWGTLLPSWYPRTPLQDITAVERAVGRRRASLRENEGQEIETPLPPTDQTLLDHDPLSVPGALLEHSVSMLTPYSYDECNKPSPSVGKVSKILRGIANANQTAGESDFITPQKKLLNSIDIVEKVVMEELQKLKRTPTAQKAEREKRVRTLMSMR